MKELKGDLITAIALTQAFADHCNVPTSKDLHLNAIEGYKKRLEEVEEKLKEM